ncbi:Abi family protein [Arthrobacter sp. TMN-49]
MAKYSKPHKTYAEQLAILSSRGLTNSDPQAAMRDLKRIGYYRLSAYTYIFREFDTQNVDSRGRPQRLDTYFPGSRFEDSVALYDYDTLLRSVLADGLQQIEIGMRVHLGHTLGKRNPFGHELRQGLDATACERRSEPTKPSTYEKWIKRYDELADQARKEDYVAHFIMNYNAEYPIWVATEFMDFGSLTWLYSLLLLDDRKSISKNLGVKDNTVTHAWLKALNVLRNDCAHHNRVWNRVTATAPVKPHESKVAGTELLHLRDLNNTRIYFLAALVGFLVTKINPQTNWPRSFKTAAGGKKYPLIKSVNVHEVMGFPADWKELPLWNYDPKI